MNRFLLIAFLLFATSSARATRLEVGGGKIDVNFSAGASADFEARVISWVKSAAEAVTKYFGRYPVSRVVVNVDLNAGDRIGSGRTFGNREGGFITIHVGRATSEAHFYSDWMLTHEMVHLAFPSVAEEHHWAEEGLATYVEPIARVMIGNLRAEQVWSDVLRDLSQGLPDDGDRGLDFTHTWGRTYWGGALFYFLADIEIHRRTANTKGLRDALHAILEAGGSISDDWELERAFRVGDAATKTTVLQDLYAQMRAAPHPVNLDELWRKLGVKRNGSTVVLQKDAPLAAVRRAMIPETE
ncbi:MAG TPA: hypothetical protein VGI60_07245 [Chthoniobacterales bacterium]